MPEILLLNPVLDSKITKSETETNRFGRLNQEANFYDFSMCERFPILTFIHLQCYSMLIAVLHFFPTCVNLSEPQSGAGCPNVFYYAFNSNFLFSNNRMSPSLAQLQGTKHTTVFFCFVLQKSKLLLLFPHFIRAHFTKW